MGGHALISHFPNFVTKTKIHAGPLAESPSFPGHVIVGRLARPLPLVGVEADELLVEVQPELGLHLVLQPGERRKREWERLKRWGWLLTFTEVLKNPFSDSRKITVIIVR